MAKSIDVTKKYKGELFTAAITFSGIRLDNENGRIEAVHKVKDNNNKYMKSPEPPKFTDMINIVDDTFLAGKITGSELLQAIQELGDNLYDDKYDQEETDV